jgi:hypothetical protein
MIKAQVVLKTGKVFDVAYADDYSFNTESFSEKITHTLGVGDNRVLVQGDRIDYVVAYGRKK